MKYTLLDGDQRHVESPRSFYMPPTAERAALRRDDFVKLGFEPPAAGPRRGELMWVVVLRTTHEGYVGVLDNEPAQDWSDTLEIGDEVAFESKHILDIQVTPHEERPN